MSAPKTGYTWDDFTAITFTGTSVRYYVGTNAVTLFPPLLSIYPVLARNPDNKQPGFTAHKVLLYATSDCYVRFNGAGRGPHIILAGNFFTFNLKVHTLYVIRLVTNGTLYVWATG